MSSSSDEESSADINDYPIYIAAKKGHADLLKKLLSEGHDYKKSKRIFSPLDRAVEEGHFECVKLLLEAAWIEFSSAEDIKKHVCSPSILNSAASNGHTRIVQLLANSLFENASAKETDYALVQACMEEEIECVKLLVNIFPSHVNDGRGCFALPIHAALECESPEALEILLCAGANAHVKIDPRGNTLLHSVCRTGDICKTKLLLEREVDVNAQNDIKVTPLHVASSAGKLDVVKLLLTKGADPSIIAWNKNSALSFAAARGHLELVQLLSDVTPHDAGSEAVRCSAWNAWYDCVKYLLSKGYPTFAPTSESSIQSDPWFILLVQDFNESPPVYKNKDISSIVRLLLENGTQLQNFAKRRYFVAPHVDTLKILLDYSLMELGWNCHEPTMVNSFSKSVSDAVTDIKESLEQYEDRDPDDDEIEDFLSIMVMYPIYFPFVKFTCVDTQSFVTGFLSENVVQNVPKLSEICRWIIRCKIASKFGVVSPKYVQELPLPNVLLKFLNYEKSVKRANSSPNASDDSSPHKKRNAKDL